MEGADINDLFETAATAVAELMVDPETISPTTERSVSLSAVSLELLLYDWLSELIYVKDSEQIVFTRANVQVKDQPPYQLTARLSGGGIDRERTALRADPKAVTLHELKVERQDRGWRARVVIDI